MAVRSVYQWIDDKLSALLGWFGVPIFVVLMLVFLIPQLGTTWGAAHGRGVHGTFIAAEPSCHRHCAVYGPFASDDHTVELPMAFMDLPPHGWQIGDRIRAVSSPGQGPNPVQSG
jgi:hypothetical protein